MSNMSNMSNLSTMSKRLSFKQSKEDCPSICIPRVFKNITIPFIVNIFQKQLKLGLIKKVSSVNNTDNNFKKIFIHFDFWYDNESVNSIKQKIINGIIIKIVYDNPWFWKCALNKSF